MLDKKRLGNNIKKEREKLHMTQAQLAERLYVTFQAISGWERGVTPPEIENICKMADIFGISVDTLLFSRGENVAYRIGIDGGGTKTEFVLFTDAGEVIKRVRLGGSNPNAIGAEGCSVRLSEGIDKLLGGVYTASALFAGVAGGASCGAAADICSALKKKYPDTEIFFDGDFINILSLSEDPLHAMGVICGTGSNVFVRMGDMVDRIGGWGYLFDKGGSGYDIGKAAIRAALSARDGMCAESILTGLVREKVGDIKSALGSIYKEDMQYVASFAPLVFRAAEEGDADAKNILRENAGRIAFLIDAAKKKFGYGGKVVGDGGLFRDPVYYGMIQEMTNAEIVVPTLPPVYGACVECCLKSGFMPGKEFYAEFERSYLEIIEKERA